jgi:hypothetical protein
MCPDEQPFNQVSFSRIAGIFVVGVCSCCSGATTIATAPSADVIAGQKVYLEFDYIANYAGYREGRYYEITF